MFIPKAKREAQKIEKEKVKIVNQAAQIAAISEAKQKKPEIPRPVVEDAGPGEEEKFFVDRFFGNTKKPELPKKRGRLEDGDEDDGFYGAEEKAEFAVETKKKRTDRFLSNVEISYKQKLKNEMTQRDWNLFREENRIQVRGGLEIFPFRSWTESELPRDLLRTLHREGFARPTAIQMQAIPVILRKRDVIGISFTGSGKTLAFLLPFVVMKMQPEIPTKAIVLAPTRELALQIQTEAKRLAGPGSPLRVVAVVGGRNILEQQQELTRGWDAIVATPGRLIDAAMEARIVDISAANYIVLDEADRMLEMGAESFLTEILQGVSAQRQVLMFSATFANEVKKLASDFLQDPVTVSVSRKESENLKIQQTVKFAKTANDKIEVFQNLLEEVPEGQIIVFCNSRAACDSLLPSVQAVGRSVGVLHAGKTQDQRENVMDGYRKKQIDVLICTDVAARGVDVSDVALVLQFDVPKGREEYTHRVGRTGRAGRLGRATTIVTPQDDGSVLLEIRDILREAGAKVPDQLEALAKHKLNEIAKLG